MTGRRARSQGADERGQVSQRAASRGRDQGSQGETLGLRVNPVACDAHGLCIEMLPELIIADPWGYPVIRPGPVPDDLLPLARRTVSACPTLALLLVRRN